MKTHLSFAALFLALLFAWVASGCAERQKLSDACFWVNVKDWQDTILHPDTEFSHVARFAFDDRAEIDIEDYANVYAGEITRYEPGDLGLGGYFALHDTFVVFVVQDTAKYIPYYGYSIRFSKTAAGLDSLCVPPAFRNSQYNNRKYKCVLGHIEWNRDCGLEH